MAERGGFGQQVATSGARGVRHEGRHNIEWRPAVKAWGCSSCERLNRWSKGGAVKNLARKSCEVRGILAGIGTGHRISFGWMDGVFSMAFCTKCGRWRSTKGKGDLGEV